jgi:hypothetical protein
MRECDKVPYTYRFSKVFSLSILPPFCILAKYYSAYWIIRSTVRPVVFLLRQLDVHDVLYFINAVAKYRYSMIFRKRFMFHLTSLWLHHFINSLWKTLQCIWSKEWKIQSIYTNIRFKYHIYIKSFLQESIQFHFKYFLKFNACKFNVI